MPADNLPGDYAPLPAGTRLMALRYTYSAGGDLYNRGDLVDEDFRYRDSQGLLSVNYYVGQDVRWLFNATLPFGRTEVDSDRLNLHQSDAGLGDPYFVIGMLPLIRETYHVGFSGWFFIPLGDYESDQVINQGMNVWSAKAEANITWKPSQAWTLELTTAARAFTDNDEFGPARAKLERSTRFLIETHVVRTVRPGLRISLDYFWHGGNETTVNGVERDDRWDDHAAQVTALWKLNGGRQLTAWYRNDFVVRSGPESQSLALRFMQAF